MNILHIDRSSFFRKLVKKEACIDCAHFYSSSSIAEAFSLLEKDRIDLILSGIELDDGSASDFLEKLKESTYSEIPVILLTSTDTLEVREKYFNLGVVDFISKNDYSADELNEHINFFNEQSSLITGLKNASIAVLDDSRFSLNVIKSILNLHGISNPATFTNPEELLGTDEAFDVYILDMVLPKISGKQMVMKLRKKNPHSVIIVISSLSNYNTIVHALESGADDYIIKPFDSRFMMARLKSNFRTFLLMKELENQNRIMAEMSVTDSLTGAKNRRFLFERLEIEISHCRRHSHPLSILMLDVDKFKSINDQYGHPQGDIVLKTLAKLFIEEIRDIDTFGRYGGEEFMLIMPETPIEEAVKAAERLRERFNETEFNEIAEGFRAAFSGGVCEWKEEELPDFIKRADLLLYKAKEAGRNNIQS